MLLTSWTNFLNKVRRRRGRKQRLGRTKRVYNAPRQVEVLETRTMLAAAIDLKVVSQATAVNANGEVSALPDSLDSVTEWDSFLVEVWGQTPDGTDDPIESYALDLEYNTSFFTATSIEYGTLFTDQPLGTINDGTGTISNLSAGTSATDVGDDAFALLARIRFDALGSDQVPIDFDNRLIGPYDLGLSVTNAQVTLVNAGDVTTTVDALPATEVFANPFDMNDDGVVNFGDFSIFAGTFRSNIPTAATAASSSTTWIADFNKTAEVNFGDFSFFAANFRKSRGDGTQVVFPENFLTAWRAPELLAGLANDTAPLGQTNADGVTSDPGLNGTTQPMAQGTAGIIRFQFAFDTAPDDFMNVAVDVTGGAFTVNENFLNQLNGGQPIPEGARAIRLRSEDSLGNLSPLVVVPFTLDRTAPDAPAFDLAVESDTGTVGDQETGLTTVSLTGTTEANAVVRLDATGATAVADANGDFRFDGVQLAEGPNVVQLTVFDAAGNTDNDARRSTTFTVVIVVDFRIPTFTPSVGSNDVGTTFRPQVFFSSPVNPDSLNANNFFASFGGEKLDARIVPANDGQFAWLFFEGSMPDASMVQVTVDGNTIFSAEDSSPLDADGDGEPGGMLQYSFSTVSLASVPNTTLIGQVLDPGSDNQPFTADDFDPGPDGIAHTDDDVFLLPIEGVEVYILGREDNVVFSDENGRFMLENVPSGNVKVEVNGLTVEDAPEDFFFPSMVMDANMMAGATNFVMSGMQELFLPRIASGILKTVNAADTTMIVADEIAAPELTPEQRSLLTIEVQPNSLVAPDGTMLDSGQVGISTVPPELVMDMLPPGVLQHTFDITVQAMGVSNFATPAPMTFPNVFNAAPGTELNFLSFDHTTGRLVIEGVATVSEDGLTVSTNPGTGITHPGWHGVTPPGSDGGFDGDEEEEEEEEEEKPSASISGSSKLFTDGGQRSVITVSASGGEDAGSVRVTVTMNGVSAITSSIDSPGSSFSLQPGQSSDITLVSRDVMESEIRALMNSADPFVANSQILTARVDVRATAMGMTLAEDSFVYGLVISEDGRLSFPTVLDEEVPEGVTVPEKVTLNVNLAGPVNQSQVNGDDNVEFQAGPPIVFQAPREAAANPVASERPSGTLSLKTDDDISLGSVGVNTPAPIDLDPFAIRRISGEIRGNVDEQKFSITGVIEFGLSGPVFEPLVKVSGSLEVTEDLISLNGMITTDLLKDIPGFGEGVVLFSGGLKIPRNGDTKTDDVMGGDGTGGDKDFTLAGLDLELSTIEFTGEGLVLKGKLTLPDKLGNVAIDIGSGENSNNAIRINSSGVELIGGATLEFPDQEFSFFGVDARATGLSLEFRKRGFEDGMIRGNRLLLRGDLRLLFSALDFQRSDSE